MSRRFLNSLFRSALRIVMHVGVMAVAWGGRRVLQLDRYDAILGSCGVWMACGLAELITRRRADRGKDEQA